MSSRLTVDGIPTIVPLRTVGDFMATDQFRELARDWQARVDAEHQVDELDPSTACLYDYRCPRCHRDHWIDSGIGLRHERYGNPVRIQMVRVEIARERATAQAASR